jgi:hypothetical protein
MPVAEVTELQSRLKKNGKAKEYTAHSAKVSFVRKLDMTEQLLFVCSLNIACKLNRLPRMKSLIVSKHFYKTDCFHFNPHCCGITCAI